MNFQSRQPLTTRHKHNDDRLAALVQDALSEGAS
jgi:hypothetical protein